MDSYYGWPRATTGESPPNSEQLAYARVGQRLYALGTSPGSAIRTSVLRYLNLKTGTWITVSHPLHNAPPRLRGHTISYCDSQLIVCGGLPDDESQTWMVYVFSLVTQTWSRHLFGRHLCFLHFHTASLCWKTWDGIGDGLSDNSTGDGGSVDSSGDNGHDSDEDSYDDSKNEAEPVLVLYGGYRREETGDSIQTNIYFLNLTNWSLFWVELPTVVSHTLKSKQLALPGSSNKADTEYLTRLLSRSNHAALVVNNLFYIYGGLIDHHGNCHHTNSMVVINLCGVYVASVIHMPNCPVPLRASPMVALFDCDRVLVYGEFCQPVTETRVAPNCSDQCAATVQTPGSSLHRSENQIWPPLTADRPRSAETSDLNCGAMWSNHFSLDMPALQPLVSQQMDDDRLPEDLCLPDQSAMILSLDLSTWDWDVVCNSKQLLNSAWNYFGLIPRADDLKSTESSSSMLNAPDHQAANLTGPTDYSTATAYHIHLEQLLSDSVRDGSWGCMDLVFLGPMTNACPPGSPESGHYSFALPPECLDLWPAAPTPLFAGSSQLLRAAEQGELIDIWFHPENGQVDKIGGHKLILLSRCPAYRAMMASGMTEARTNEIVVPESAATIRAWREYLYTDMITCDLTLDSLLDLMRLAHMHSFPTLRQLVVLPIIEDYLCVDTAIEIIERAVLANDNALAYLATQLLVTDHQEHAHTVSLDSCSDQVKALIDFYTTKALVKHRISSHHEL